MCHIIFRDQKYSQYKQNRINNEMKHEKITISLSNCGYCTSCATFCLVCLAQIVKKKNKSINKMFHVIILYLFFFSFPFLS